MSGKFPFSSCVVIGAGISGLIAARTLESAGIDVVVIDKARGVGGRMATRRIDGARIDHGAQFFTVRNDAFEAMVTDWLDNGLIHEWSKGFPIAGSEYKADGHSRYVGSDGMTTVPKYLAIPLDLRLQTRIEAIVPGDERWILRSASDEEIEAEALIVTVPIPQALALLEAGEAYLPEDIMGQLKNIRYDPCIAVMAVFNEPVNLPEPGAVRLEQGPVTWIADNNAKGISPHIHTVTIHTSPQFSREHLKSENQNIIERVIDSVREYLPGRPETVQVHRWHYSQPVVAHQKAFLMIDVPAPLVFAGDGFDGSKIEGAALSGLAAAKALLTRA